jgi:pantoate--beta-alanine ligase
VALSGPSAGGRVRRLESCAEVGDAVRAARRAGHRVGYVPTMGFLHEGHLSLVDRARALADRVVVSIFVNPLQFGPGEDLARYPRDLERDAALCEARGVDLLFTPSAEALYPAGEPVVRVVPGPLAERLCGAYRPGHFAGVLTVVAKLFHVVPADVAVFGQKDYQQALLIRCMVRDLDFPIAVDVAPTVREADGLAMSSRNAYLASAERSRAALLHQGLAAALAAYRDGVRQPAALVGIAEEFLVRGGVRPQYLELVDGETLAPPAEAKAGDVLAVAAHVGATRLIDNVILS